MAINWEATSPVRTDAGMFALWQPEAFSAVADIDSWESQVAEDSALTSHVEAGEFVPINIGMDGAFGFTVRVGTGDLLSDREREYVAVTSEAYRLAARGAVFLSGLEQVGSQPREAVRVPTTPGDWAVTIQFVDWSAEPGFVDEDGNPLEGALSDFVIEVRPAEANQQFRRALETFERPG